MGIPKNQITISLRHSQLRDVNTMNKKSCSKNTATLIHKGIVLSHLYDNGVPSYGSPLNFFIYSEGTTPNSSRKLIENRFGELYPTS